MGISAPISSMAAWRAHISPRRQESALALAACRALGLDFGGVDLLEAEDGPVVCEVNSNAHFAGLLSATGVNPADHIMQYIRRTVCEE